MPEGAGVLLVRGEGSSAERGNRDGLPRMRQIGSAGIGRGRGATAVVDDHRQGRAMCVVIALSDQPGDVEEVEIEPLRRDERHGGARHDVRVLADLRDRRVGNRPVRARFEAERPPAVASRQHVDDVPVISVTVDDTGGAACGCPWAAARRASESGADARTIVKTSASSSASRPILRAVAGPSNGGSGEPGMHELPFVAFEAARKVCPAG